MSKKEFVSRTLENTRKVTFQQDLTTATRTKDGVGQPRIIRKKGSATYMSHLAVAALEKRGIKLKSEEVDIKSAYKKGREKFLANKEKSEKNAYSKA